MLMEVQIECACVQQVCDQTATTAETAKNECMRFTGRKRKADWIMDKKEKGWTGRNEKTGKRVEKRDAAVQHAVKVRLMPPRGGADIRGRMSSSNVPSLTFFLSLSFLFVPI